MAAQELERTETMALRDDRLVALYQAHASDGVRLAYVLTGSRETAEDITQEAFVRAGRRIVGIRNPQHAKAYLFRTIVNLARGQGRRLLSGRRALGRLQSPGPAHMPAIEERDELWGELLTLPHRQRAAIFLRYYLDQSEAQAAETLDCSLSAIKSLVSRGLRTLRNSLEGRDR